MKRRKVLIPSKSLVVEVLKVGNEYILKGGTTNRQQQFSRMMAFAAYAERLEAREMAQVGRRHCLSYWRATEHLKPSTRYSHWLAMCKLWKLLGKPGMPPPPPEHKEKMKKVKLLQLHPLKDFSSHQEHDAEQGL